jgi:hypothetical protein
MLRKKSNERKKTNVKRKHNSRLIKEKSILAETEKEVVTPMSLAGFPTCFNFLRIPAIEKKNTDQNCHLNGQNKSNR